ncbi:MAG: hypothetical protein ACJAT2_001778 [Bacteriovoracaceae bacterium]|jgi:hypothetical protein
MSLKNKTISIDPKCTWKELSGQVIVLQASCHPPMTHELNSSGSFIWTLLGPGPQKFSDLLEALNKTYEADSCELETDLTSLIKQLEDLKLVRFIGQ